ncbi:ABC transporter substrate-binding protein [Advenella kashmirensis W13003]|uniref:ABC transporter substrate-binding protein n=1 Tax=Advenella kashmirensis W13003 TaxID=1424334 RepID=V8QY41_9BURK|nr:tripartite tricarboxylate transporter substrate binding protein [Advenella kashmirensis]ETF03944.1 ABC transporter substrate-binding protein [Advenella kashmirensis W13003]
MRHTIGSDKYSKARRAGKKWAAFTMAVAGSCFAFTAHSADDWPSRPIQIIVPFGPGGTTDLLARLVADGLSKSLKQSVVVENKPGAGGNIGAAAVAHAKPDGYTLLMGTPGPLAINANIYPDMGYKPETDFAAVSYVADVPNVILTNPATGIKNIEELLAAAKERPGKLNWGSPGVGSTGHIQLELLKQLAGVDITHVPYKGASQSKADLLAGHIQLSGDNVPTALEQIRSGKLVALGVASENELPVLPGVAPVGKSVPGYVLQSWFVIVAPAATPKPVVDRLSATIDAYMKEPAVHEQFQKLGATPVGGPPERLAKQLASEQTRYRDVMAKMKETK